MDPTCVFCRILAGEMEGSFVARTAKVSVFMDIMPVNPGHLLVIPNAHHVYLSDVPGPTAAAMFTMAQDVAKAIRSSDTPADGVNIFLADGEAAGQEVFHCHLHVIPRLVDDGFVIHPNYGPPPSRTELDALAQSISAHL